MYIIKECLIASKSKHELFMLDNHPLLTHDKNANFKVLKDREELKYTLVVSQDTAVIQILLEVYLLTIKVRIHTAQVGFANWNLHESVVFLLILLNFQIYSKLSL
jgi:hypothetical protein